MAIVQISKIIHRTGANIDLPQLDIGEIGFATDEQRVYIGNDPNIVPPVTVGATTQTEILTTASPLDFSRIEGSSNASANISSPENGQLLGINVAANVTSIVNVGGNAGGQITLGTVSNVKLNGGVNGYVLQTDGTGNLTWTTNGTLQYKILGFSQFGAVVTDGTLVTTSTPHSFGTGTMVTISGVLPTGVVKSSIETAGVGGTNQFYTYRRSNTTFTIHDTSGLSNVDYNALWSGYTANSADIVGQISPVGNAVVDGSNTQIQFNDAGSFGASANLTFNKSNKTLTVIGTTTSSNLNSSNITGIFNGTIGCTAPNLASFTSITVNNNANVVGTITAATIVANTNGIGENFKVGDDMWIGDINIADTIQVKGIQDSANAYIVFGDGDTTSLGRSGTGPLTYGGDVEATGNVTAANINLNTGSNTWTMFANVDGIFCIDNLTGNSYQVNLTQI